MFGFSFNTKERKNIKKVYFMIFDFIKKLKTKLIVIKILHFKIIYSLLAIGN